METSELGDSLCLDLFAKSFRKSKLESRIGDEFLGRVNTEAEWNSLDEEATVEHCENLHAE